MVEGRLEAVNRLSHVRQPLLRLHINSGVWTVCPDVRYHDSFGWTESAHPVVKNLSYSTVSGVD